MYNLRKSRIQHTQTVSRRFLRQEAESQASWDTMSKISSHKPIVGGPDPET